jgi:3-oxoadipate enol-lactonase
MPLSSADMRLLTDSWPRRRLGPPDASIDAFVLGDLAADAVPLVLVHGIGVDGRMFVNQTPLAARRALILPNLSSASIQDGTMDGYARCVLGAIKSLGRPVFLGGVSMGGMVSMAAALIDPALIRGILLVSTSANGSGARKFFHVAEGVFRRMPRPAARAAAPVLKFYVNRMRDLSQAEREFHTAVLLSFSVDHMKSAGRASISFDARDRINRITVPTTVIHGTKDAMFPLPEAEFLASRIPGAQLTPIARGTHFIIMHRAEEVNAAMESFMNSIPPHS